jgi:hypothetical protein
MLNKYIKIFRNILLLTLIVIIATSCSNIGDINKGTKTAAITLTSKVTMTELTAETNSIALTWTNPADSDLKNIDISWTDGTTPGSFEVSDENTYTISGLLATTEYTITLTMEDTAGNKSVPVSFSVSTSSTLTYYFIFTATDLNAVRGGETGYGTWTLSGNYILMADIDLTAYSPWTPLGDIGTFFSGIFEGNDHVVNNLTINSSNDFQGLFGVIDSGSKIKQLGVQCTIIDSGDYAGGLAGASLGTISNCYSSGTISSTNDNVGGLAGLNGGIISNCYSTGTVTGASYVGGFIGGNNNDGTISSCYSTGAVNGTSSVGGLAGRSPTMISNCYATGSVTGTTAIGGLVGDLLGTIEYSYATGHVTGTSSFGGLVGFYDHETITSCYYDSTTTDVIDNGAGTPLTTAQMKVQANFTGWDFTGEIINGTDNLWSIGTINNGYPYLTNNH